MSTKSLFLCAALAAAGVIACHPGKLKVTTQRPECPRDVIWIPRDSVLTASTVVAASGAISMVPEYHDCQRFLSTGKTAFGPMIAIFASSGLDSASDPVAPTSPTTVTITGRDKKAAATILDYDGPYDQLHIESGINCLYMGTENGIWKARIVRVQSDTTCLRPSAGVPGGVFLKVQVTAGPKDIPAVARWDWDEEHRQHYIGIRCGTRWCEVFNPNLDVLHSSASYPGPDQVANKGLYDEQILAINGTGQALVPGGVVGTIFPIGQLDRNVDSDFVKKWKPVAMVSLAAQLEPYKHKFNFVPGIAPEGNSNISMCKGTRDECAVPQGEVNQCDNSGDPWWARIVSGQTTQYRCVVRRTHAGVPIPGAVRWRWQNTDEDMWVRCPAGCCEIT
jgi:hypothetical protein